MEQLFNLEEVSYSYIKPYLALADINLSIARNKSYVILGANGSGKSTLLKLLDGLIFPDAGSITAFGRPLTERSLNTLPYMFRREVGFVFQDSDVQLFCPTVYDEIAFAPLQMGWEPDRVRDAVDRTLDEYGLHDLRDRPPYRLSGGEKKKVALASVTIIQPRVLLLDEPTSGLDPRTRRWFLEKLAQAKTGETTIVIATHDIESSRFLADYILVMNEEHGVEAVGEPAAILENEDLLRKVNLL